MPIIKCPECNHEISTYADKCIYCGCPMNIIQKLLAKKTNKKTKTQKQKEQPKKEKKEKLTFSESLSSEELSSLNRIGKSICDKYPDLVALMTKYFYGIKEKNDNFYIFWFVRDGQDIVLKTLDERKADSRIIIKKINLLNEKEIIEGIENKIKKYGGVGPVQKQTDKEGFEDKQTSPTIERHQRFIEEFASELRSKYSDFEESYSSKSTLFKMKGTECSWFYLSIDGYKLLFKYRDQPFLKYQTNEMIVDDIKKQPKDLMIFVDVLIRKANIDIKKRIKLIDISDSLTSYLKGKKKKVELQFASICEEVSSFVYSIAKRYNDSAFTLRSNESTNKYVQKIRYLAYYKYRPTVKKDAEDIFLYFVANKLYDVIKTYDSTFSGVISKHSDLLNSLIDMLESGDVEFDRCAGITSKFSLVPNSVLEEELSKYIVK